MGGNAISVIILTFNEEANISSSLKSLKDLTEEIFIVDSFSTDKTLEIAKNYTDKIYQNPWNGWAAQRNWALANLNISTEWILFLDADEQVTPEFSEELKKIILEADNSIAGLNVRFNFIFLGRRLRFAYESPPVLRVIRRGKANWYGEGAREYAIVYGQTVTVQVRLLHQDQKGLAMWVNRQTKNAQREAWLTKMAERGLTSSEIVADTRRTHERPWRRYLRDRVWKRLPHFGRPFLYFFYRYVLRGGFLDGRAGFAYCFLQALWYPLLIDMMTEEYIIHND